MKKPTKTVLLIDDDLQLVKLLKNNLRQEGYNVYCGFDGGTALSMAQRYRPDIILMDLNMPNINGLTAFENLRADTKTAHIPVVFISEMVSQVMYPFVQSVPRAAYLKKPLDLIDLNSFLRQFIQQYVN